MLNNNKSIVIATAALLAGLMLGTATQAGFEDRGAERAVSSGAMGPNSLDSLALRPGYDMLRPVVDGMVTASIAPTLETTAPVRRSAPNYNVFKSVVVPVGKLPAFAQWGKVQPAGVAAAPKKFAALVEKARGLSQVEALTLINREVNRTIKYRSDKGDQWQTLAQSAARGTGDCEDYAIAKMTLLADLGFRPDQLQFIVLKDTRRQLYHAVLAVHVEGKRYILDNLSNTAASDDIFRTYKPIASFVGPKTYIHGFKDGAATAVAGGFGSISLGN
jgi:predicted transglutaminase-like cysteine proteinase